jgi:hypothetical protein
LNFNLFPSPWFNSASPSSSKFLGAVIERIDGFNDPTFQRSPQSGMGLGTGGALGPLSTTYREFTVTALLFACDQGGMQYGVRWLNDKLKGGGCTDDACQVCDAEVRLSCDPANIDEGRWQLYDVGLIDGPHYTQVFQNQDCHVLRATFVMGSESPYLYKCENRVLPPTPFPARTVCNPFDCSSVSAFIDEPLSVGSTAAKVIIRTGAKRSPRMRLVGRVDIFGQACPPPSTPKCAVCPEPPTSDNCISMDIASIPANSTFVYDSVRREVYLEDAVGNRVQGSSLLTVPAGQPFTWLDVTCGGVCLTVKQLGMCADSSVTVEVVTVHREF